MKVKTLCPPQHRGETFPSLSQPYIASCYFLSRGHQKRSFPGGLQDRNKAEGITGVASVGQGASAGLGHGCGEDALRSTEAYNH